MRENKTHKKRDKRKTLRKERKEKRDKGRARKKRRMEDAFFIHKSQMIPPSLLLKKKKEEKKESIDIQNTVNRCMCRNFLICFRAKEEMTFSNLFLSLRAARTGHHKNLSLSLLDFLSSSLLLLLQRKWREEQEEGEENEVSVFPSEDVLLVILRGHFLFVLSFLSESILLVNFFFLGKIKKKASGGWAGC